MRNNLERASSQGEEFSVAYNQGHDFARDSQRDVPLRVDVLDSNVGIALNELSVARTGNSLHIADSYPSELQAMELLDGRMSESIGSCGLVEAELRRALEHQEFQVHYQPIVYLETGQIVGFEALVRWQHPTRGLLSPVDFLQATEKTGLIVPLGLWVLREASHQMHQWHRRFPDNPLLHVSVNVSSKQFQQPDLVEQISQILHETGLNPGSLQLEITETLVMQNSEPARNILLQLRALNVKLAIDDFGTGYSSLGYLQEFPVHSLKIDRSFISRLQDAKESLEIVRAVVNLAHNLGLDVIAEGVETANHAAILKILKCEFGQGYFYSKPVDTKCSQALIVRHAQAQFAMPAADVTEEKAGGTLNANEVCIGQYPAQASPSGMTNSSELEKSVRVHFDNRDGQALKKIMTLASGQDLRNWEAGTSPDEAQGSQEQRLREEFEIHIEDLKQEAIKQFDQELYSVCLATFQFLCELEPDNRTLRDYLELTERLVSGPATETGNSTSGSKTPRQSPVSATENNVGVTEGRSVEATAFTFGNTAGLENGQESNQSNRSISPQIRSSSEVDGEVENQGTKATEGQSDSTGTSRNKKLLALLAAVAAVVFGATLDLWTNRQKQNAAASSVVQLDKPAVDRRKLSDLEATAKSLHDQGNLQEASRRCDDILLRDPQNAYCLDLKESIRPAALPDTSGYLAKSHHQESHEESVSAAGVAGSQPKQLPGAGSATLATLKNPVRKLSPETLMYAVIHDHLIGSCRGKLKISGESIVFEPSQGSRHGFVFKLTDIIGTERGDALKIKFKHDVYRFKTRFARDKRDNQSTLAAIDQKLTRARAEVGLAKH